MPLRVVACDAHDVAVVPVHVDQAATCSGIPSRSFSAAAMDDIREGVTGGLL